MISDFTRGLPIKGQPMTESKPTNPKDAVGVKKVTWSVIPWNVIAQLANVLLEGAMKYGRHNWRKFGVRASVYLDAADRHQKDWWEGQDYTPEGTYHLDNAIASLVVLRDSILCGNWIDDRPPKAKPWLDEANKEAARIVSSYPHPVKAYTERDDVLPD